MGMDFRGQALKIDEENDICWSEIGSGFDEPGGTPPPKIPGSTTPTHPPCYGHICMLYNDYNQLISKY